ncbi:MAG: DUF2807 domain-containing protein [Bacteroidales bacterium]|nr:DUF2807 domain-containing protein [Bacteroidales bacterium]
MKSILFSLAGLLLVTATCFGIVSDDKSVLTEKRNVSDFNQLIISGPYKVTVEIGKKASLEIRASKDMMQYCKSEVNNGVLRVYLLDQPSHFRWNNNTLEAYITVDYLTSVEMGGASKMIWNGAMKTDQWKLNVGGASKFETSSPLNLKHCDIRIGGASKVDMNGKIITDDFNMNIGGASKAIVTVETGISEVSVNGASHLDISGSCVEMKAKANGASRIAAESFICENINAEASGASSASVNAKKSIIGRKAGASNIRVSGNPTNVDLR